jgi:futalosine hydrolase
MKILLVAATPFEIQPFLDFTSSSLHPFQGTEIEVLVTGIGIAACTYALTKRLQTCPYDFALQAGVCGSFDHSIALGSVLNITTDRFADLGIEDREQYLDIFETGLIDPNQFPFTTGILPAPSLPAVEQLGLRTTSGITVNTVSGNEKTVALRFQKYRCDTESMEGAAFHYVCLQEGVNFAQLRAVSNYVEPRDKSKWQMKKAITNLNHTVIQFIENI